MFRPIRTAGPRIRTALSFALATALLLFSAAGSAEDARPSYVPYDTPGEFPTLDPGFRRSSRQVVRIRSHALEPRLTVLRGGEQIAWLSQSPVPSTIVFEREVAADMICHRLVNFSIEEDELRSAPVHAGEVASFCELRPGHYRYKVVRTLPANSDAVGAARRLEGVIVVEQPG